MWCGRIKWALAYAAARIVAELLHISRPRLHPELDVLGHVPQPVRFQNSAIGPDLGFYVARSYSLMRPPSTGRRWIRFRERSAAG